MAREIESRTQFPHARIVLARHPNGFAKMRPSLFFVVLRQIAAFLDSPCVFERRYTERAQQLRHEELLAAVAACGERVAEFLLCGCDASNLGACLSPYRDHRCEQTAKAARFEITNRALHSHQARFPAARGNIEVASEALPVHRPNVKAVQRDLRAQQAEITRRRVELAVQHHNRDSQYGEQMAQRRLKHLGLYPVD